MRGVKFRKAGSIATVLPALFLLFFVAVAPVHAAGGPTIVVFGDSLSAGYGLPRGQDFASQLQRALDRRGVRATILNRSRSGRTTGGGVRAFRSIPAGTDGVIVQLGGNDGLRGVPVARARKNLDTILSRLRGRGIPVLLAGIGTLPKRGKSYARQFSAMYSGLARKHGARLYPNFLTGVYGNRSLVLRDRIHPNARGVAEMVRRLLPSVVALVRRAGTS